MDKKRRIGTLAVKRHFGSAWRAKDYDRSVDAAFEVDDLDSRLTALETLRWLSETKHNPEAVELAAGALDAAEDEVTERAALEVLVRYGDEEEVLRILEPIALNEGPNQDLAVREWIRIRDERRAREQAENQTGSKSRQ